MPKRKHPRRPLPTFLKHTYELLSDVSLASIVSWDKSGRVFEVKDVSAFTSQVLPQFFKHSNLTSFMRQLNMYDFQKLPGRYAFTHPQFVRGSSHKLNTMRRKVAAGSEQHEEQLCLFSSEDLERTIYLLQTSQHDLELQISSLKDQNHAIGEQNGMISKEISEFKERCQQMDEVLSFLNRLTMDQDNQELEEPAFEPAETKPGILTPSSNVDSPSTDQFALEDVLGT